MGFSARCAWILLVGCCSIVVSQRSGQLRFSGNLANERSGRLEIFISGTWGTVCSTGFTLASANTACRQLGFNGAVSFGTSAALGYGVGAGPIHLTEVQCGEDDNHVLRCPLVQDTTACTHMLDIGVQCRNTSAFEFEGGVRLVNLNGSYQPEGRLEVYLFGVWGPICANFFNRNAADAVCQQLGYTQSNDFNTISMAVFTVLTLDTPTCSGVPLPTCFRSCYPRPGGAEPAAICAQNGIVHVSCDYFLSLNSFRPAGTSSSCSLDADSGDDSNDGGVGLGVGLGIGLGVPLLVVLIILIIRYKKELRSAKTRLLTYVGFDDESPNDRRASVDAIRFSSNTGTSTIPAGYDEPSAVDSDKPPEYDKALEYKSAPADDQGYPEPSLVDSSAPPNYPTTV